MSSAPAVTAAQGVATVVVLAALGAAAVALVVAVSRYKDTQHQVQTWRRWEAHIASPEAAQRRATAQHVLEVVRDLVTTTIPNAAVTMFGSQALLCADASSDTDIKVVVGGPAEVRAVADALLGAGFRQAAATKRYVLFRNTVGGMPTDVSVVTTSTPSDSPETLSPVLRATKGFLLWYIRTNGGQAPSPAVAAVSVHTYRAQVPPISKIVQIAHHNQLQHV
jgi:hypothetical protein